MICIFLLKILVWKGSVLKKRERWFVYIICPYFFLTIKLDYTYMEKDNQPHPILPQQGIL